MRINKYLALAGLGSRRNVEVLITTGKIKVNGKVVSKTLLSSDSYGATPTIISVGTKKQVDIYKE